MPIVLGLGGDAEWNDPLNLYGGKAPVIGLGGEEKSTSTRTSRLPDMSDRDYSDIVDTIIAEAAGEGDDGMAAVASVIRNRSAARGKPAGDIVREPYQFTGYEKPGADARKAQRDPEMRARAEAVLNGIFSGEMQDPTSGADHYHADYVSPDWSKRMPETTRVGRHIFYASGQRPARTAAEAIETITPESGSERPLRLTSAQQAAGAEDGGNSLLLSKLQQGKPSSYISNMSDGLRGGLTAMFEEAPDYVRSGLDILSGARTPERQAQIIADHAGKYGFSRKEWLADVSAVGPVEAGKKWRPAFRKLGLTKNIGMPGGSKHQHGTAADLGWNGGAFSAAPAEARQWVHANAERFGLHFPMGHEPWHIETADARRRPDAIRAGKARCRHFRPARPLCWAGEPVSGAGRCRGAAAARRRRTGAGGCRAPACRGGDHGGE